MPELPALAAQKVMKIGDLFENSEDLNTPGSGRVVPRRPAGAHPRTPAGGCVYGRGRPVLLSGEMLDL